MLQWPHRPSRGQVCWWLIVDDPQTLAAIAAVNSRLAKGKSAPSASSFALQAVLIFAVALVLLGLAVWQGLPWIAGRLSAFVPLSVEEKLGEASLEAIAPRFHRCRDESVERILRRLETTVPSSGYRFRVWIVEDESINAFAAPGGYIVVYRGLLRKTRRPEQLAAVLAHEMQHVIQRHGTKAMLRSVSLWLALAFFTGDANSAIAVMVGNLGSLAYHRADEERADQEAVQMMAAARLDPREMVSMLELLNQETPELPRAARYFSTHPLTADRIEAVRKQVESLRVATQPLEAGTEWPPARSACRTEPASQQL